MSADTVPAAVAPKVETPLRRFLTDFLASRLAIAGLIEYMHNKGQVWFARLDEIAAYIQQLAQAGTWTPRVDRLPYYPGPIPELGEAEPTLAR